MGTYTLNYGTKGARIIAAFGEHWQEQIDGSPNPQTKQEFAEQELLAMIKEKVIHHEARIAQIQARDDSLTNNNFDITIT